MTRRASIATVVCATIAGYVLPSTRALSIGAQQATFRSAVELVQMDVSVMRGGKPVPGLAAADFVVTDKGVVQTVESVSVDRLPLTVLLVLDTSSSVAGDRLEHLRQAADGVVTALRESDRAGVLSFATTVSLQSAIGGDRDVLRAAIARLAPGGDTALLDAVHLALTICPRDPDRRPLVLVFTDGVDSTSWLTEAAVLDSARRAGIVVHAIGVQESRFLQQLASVTGGRTWLATSDRQLRELFTTALDEMRARYVLRYTPHGVAASGWHEVGVKLRGGAAEITARPGYFVSPTR